MKYNKGNKFYKINYRDQLVSLEIEDIYYKIKGGTIDNRLYLTEKELDSALENNLIYLNKDTYNKMKRGKLVAEIEKLQNELNSLD